MNRPIRIVSSPRATIRAALAAFAASAVALPALAGWSAAQESIENHPTWIYTPATTQPGGQRALLVVLHGCDQTNTQLKQAGNLEATSERSAVVVAVPGVGSRSFGPGCWNYDGARDDRQHIAELVRLTQKLVARRSLGIDARQVFVTGVSSGGAMALDVGCKAPDLFAGVGAVAGPSVGSNQVIATLDATAVFSRNVPDAVARCRALAGRKASHFATQIASVAFGDMDRNGSRAAYWYSRGDTAHSGQYQLVSTKWSTDNAKIFQQLYGTGGLGAQRAVQQGRALLQEATKGGARRLSLLEVHEVGHAWPSGKGGANRASEGGVWIAQAGLDYADFLVGWMTANNTRRMPQDEAGGVPVVASGGPGVAPPGTTQPQGDCLEVADSNFNHVHAGRAGLCGFAYVCANGSGDNLGLFHPRIRSTLMYSQAAPEYFSKGSCTVAQRP